MNPAEQFEAMVSAYYEPLYRFAMSLTRSVSEAQDLTQQTFYTWATKGHQLRDHSKAKTWLFTTLHRTFLLGRRRQSRFPQPETEEILVNLPAESRDMADHVDAAQVLPALARVDEVFRAPLVLFYLEDYAYKDIAAILEVPIGTVKSRIARGVLQLREMLSADGSVAKRSPVERDLSAAAPAEPNDDCKVIDSSLSQWAEALTPKPKFV